MVKMIRDLTGRFAQRPYYLAGELDRECEQIVAAFLTARHGKVRLPITTDELSLLIELEGADLDSCVDLSPDPPPVKWSAVMIRKRRIENGQQATEAGRDCLEVAAG